MKNFSNRIVLDSLGLPLIKDIYSLAQQLRLSEKLVYYLSHEDAYGRYNTFKIPKKDGTFRKISAPIASLKIVQRWVLENILYKIKATNYSYGFNRTGLGSPLVMCAEKHKNNLYILKMDFKNFFPSITRERVFYQFINMGYNTYASNLLTNICINKNQLPQGAVTSPYLANIICQSLDIRIAGYCNKRDIVYTRYADDMIFSSDNRDSLRNIFGMVEKIARSEGFHLNKKKTIFMSPKCHKKVLGVTVNDNLLKAPKEYKKMLRTMIHRAIISGNYSDTNRIKGYISYIDSIEKGYKTKICNYIKKYYNDSITLFSEAVDAYNSNKLFEELPDMHLKNPEDFVDYSEIDDYICIVTKKREDFLRNAFS